MVDTQRSVKLRIVADAGTAKATLDDIAEKTDQLDGKKSSINVRVNSGTSKEQLDEITAKADALGIKNIRFTVKADTAKADVEMAATGVEADRLRDKLAKLAAEQSAAAAAGGLLRVGLLGLAPAMIPVAAAAVSISAGLVPALAAGGIGLGVFGLAAKGAFAEVTKADKANKTLTGGLGEMQTAVNTAKTAWQGWIAQSANGVAHTLAPALSVVPTLLKDMTMFLKPAEAGLRTLATQFKTAFDSKGAQDFVGKLSGLVQPAIVNLGDAFGHVLHGVGGLFKGLMPQAGGVEKLIVKISEAFDRWANSASTASGIKSLFAYFQSTGPKLGQIFKELAADIPKIVSALAGFGGASLSGISVILSVIGKLSPGQLQLVAGAILGISAAFKVARLAMIAFTLASDVNPIMLALTGVALVILLVVTHLKTLEGWAKNVFNWVKGHWPLIGGILLGPFAFAVPWIVKHLGDVKNFISNTITHIRQSWPTIKAVLLSPFTGFLNWVRGVPGWIVNALSSIPSLMSWVGKNLVIGIWNGIISLGGWLWGQISGFVSNYILNPVKSFLGMNSPSKVFHGFGEGIIQGLANGINGKSGQAVSAVTGLSRAVAGAFNPDLNASISGAAANAGNRQVVFSPTINVSGVVGDAAATGRQIVQAANTYLRQTGQGQLAGA